MPQVSVTIGGRAYRLHCEDGQEDGLRAVAETVDERITKMRADVGEIGDQRLIVMAALSICDDYLEAHKANEDLRLRAAEALDVARSARDHAEATARMATEAMNESARRIEACAEALAEDDKDD